MTEVAILKITLKEVSPAVWRRVEFPTSLSFAKLHGVIQALFGWENAHLHEFNVDGEAIGIKGIDAPPETSDGRRRKVAPVLQRGVRSFTYNYDFGDDWECDIEVERIEATSKRVVLPRCVDGERSGPPEDCGGAYLYSQDVKKLRGSGPRRSERLRWYESDFDPEHFDVKEANARIRSDLEALSSW